MTETLTVEEMARELAERTLPSIRYQGVLLHNAMQRKKAADGYEAKPLLEVPENDGRTPDPRFASLRGKHGDNDGCWHLPWRCASPGMSYCLRTDLGAIVRAAAAYNASLEVKTYPPFDFYSARVFGALWHTAATPEEAAIRALYEAVTS